ncbi:Hypothetical predicted protein [Octopus vulgaris]|uniref:Uncharacterized protein n=1 Tax=Octopus vulgaris TaxID=6645 RepID=A0AA36BH53_OCTVU|nr:Hypothetical predicted protein [Octopus vulgaris]
MLELKCAITTDVSFANSESDVVVATAGVAGGADISGRGSGGSAVAGVAAISGRKVVSAVSCAAVDDANNNYNDNGNGDGGEDNSA